MKAVKVILEDFDFPNILHATFCFFFVDCSGKKKRVEKLKRCQKIETSEDESFGLLQQITIRTSSTISRTLLELFLIKFKEADRLDDGGKVSLRHPVEPKLSGKTDRFDALKDCFGNNLIMIVVCTNNVNRFFKTFSKTF